MPVKPHAQSQTIGHLRAWEPKEAGANAEAVPTKRRARIAESLAIIISEKRRQRPKIRTSKVDVEKFSIVREESNKIKIF
jgi:hypothetical protein